MDMVDAGSSTALLHHVNNAVVDLTLHTSASIDLVHKAEQCNNVLLVKAINISFSVSHKSIVLDPHPIHPACSCVSIMHRLN